MKSFMLLMFAISSGLTLSGIVANVYRLVSAKPKGDSKNWVYYGVMTVAGPTVLFDNAARTFRRKECTAMALIFALGLAIYWAMVLGAILLDVVVSV